MSLDYERAVLVKSKSKGASRLVLMILAFHANKGGECWPYRATLAKEANCSLPALDRALGILKKLEEIEISPRGRSRSSLYKILINIDNHLAEKVIKNDKLTDENLINIDKDKEKRLSILNEKVINIDKHELKGTTTKDELPTTDTKSHLNNLASHLAAVCQINIDLASDNNRDAIKSLTVALDKQSVTVNDIDDFGKYWSAFDWRGQRGQSPTPKQVGDSWGAFEAQRKNGSPNVTTSDRPHVYNGPPLTDDQKQILAQMRKDKDANTSRI